MNSEYSSSPDTTVIHSLQEVSKPLASTILLLVLAVSVLLMSVSFNLYLMKLNKALSVEHSNQLRVAEQGSVLEGTIRSMLNELGPYALQHPEVRDILAKYNINIVVTPPPVTTPPPPIPTPFSKR